jgi:hypothetical protein
VLGSGGKNLGLGDGERREGKLELRKLLGEQGLVIVGIGAGQWHELKGGKSVSETAGKKPQSGKTIPGNRGQSDGGIYAGLPLCG